MLAVTAQVFEIVYLDYGALAFVLSCSQFVQDSLVV
jgi:hypothetical protein